MTTATSTETDTEWAEKALLGHKLLPRDESERSHETKLMTNGFLYDPLAPEHAEGRMACRLLMYAYNSSSPVDMGKRSALLKLLLGSSEDDLYIEPDLKMDYGRNTSFGKRCALNYDCTILDVAHVTIGDNFMAAPSVCIFTATHPTDPTLRSWSGRELGFSIVIGNNVWLGGHATVCPGVHIGDNVVVGAGAVVTRDVPANSVVVGNPARIVKTVVPPAGLPYGYLSGPQPHDYDKDGNKLPKRAADGHEGAPAMQ